VCFIIFYGYFYEKAQAQRPEQPALSPSVVGQPLPQSRLVDADGSASDDAEVRKGKVVLAFVSPECDACLDESKFLATVVKQRGDVRFYGVVSFAESKDALRPAEGKFPFKLLFDEGSFLRKGLSIKRLPTKVYLEDGVIKKTWIGSTAFYGAEQEFGDWLRSL
jgi:hypothetical protein